MQRRAFPRFDRCLLATSASAVLLSAAPAMAARPVGTIGLRAGAGSHYQRLGLSWSSPSLADWQTGEHHRIDLVGELDVAYWRADGSRSPASVWQFGVTPFVRWSIADRFYLEAGVGATVFTRTRFAGKNLSTAFQFGDHIGAGIYLARDSRLGVRLSHFSNADIKTPNPGLNLVQILYDCRY